MALMTVGLTSAAHSAIIVDEDPVDSTPHVLDGYVLSVVRVGGQIVLGGTFTQASNSGDPEVLYRHGLLAFDAESGQISETFAPAADGEVAVVLPAPGGKSVYVGGRFSNVGESARDKLARVRLSDGKVLKKFSPGAIDGQVRDGQVRDLRMVDGRLWVAGSFTSVNGVPRTSLATLKPKSGKLTSYMDLNLTGTHNGGFTTVSKIDVSPNGKRLAGIGNFTKVDGHRREQLFQLKLKQDNPKVTAGRTRFYQKECGKNYNTYVRDVAYSPDGKFYVVGTTGARGRPASSCDTNARFETAAKGSRVKPTWIATSGGDTTLGIEVTDRVVYIGGHFRWANNSYGHNDPGPGAVERSGIAALDTLNGLPYSWNPGRARGVGIFDFLLDDLGLWVASDNELIGGERRPRIALLPSLGQLLPTFKTPKALDRIFLGGGTGQQTDPSVLYRVDAGGAAFDAPTGIRWDGDTKAAPSPLHDGGSKPSTRPSVTTLGDGVPAGTPKAVFDSARRTKPAKSKQKWDFPVTAGTPLEVRLYFAAPCACEPGVNPVFDVRLDGTVVLDDFDLRAEAAPGEGIVRSFPIEADGRVDLNLSTEQDAAQLSAVEIVRTDAGAPPTSGLVHRDHSSGSFASLSEAPAGDVDWSSAAGAFVINDELYVADATTGQLTRRTFDGSSYGTPTAVDTADGITPLTSWHDDIAAMTGLFYDQGRVYFTLAGSDVLHYRYFEPESDLVGAVSYVADKSRVKINYGDVRGMVLVKKKLYWATPDGSLHKGRWVREALVGEVSGDTDVVSGPAVDRQWWTGRTLFGLESP